MNKTVTIKLREETKKLLDLLKKYDNQTYDELLTGLIEDKLEEHLELRPEIKKAIISLSNEIKAKKVKALSLEKIYEKVYG